MVTHGFALLCGVVLLVLTLTGGLREAAFLGGIMPARLSGAIDLAQAAVPPWLTPLSSAFLHNDVLHYGFNAAMLVFCGRQCEPVLGAARLGILLILGAYAAALAEWAVNPAGTQVIVGASGAISALVGFYALLFNDQQVRAVGPIPGSVVRVLWLGLSWIGLQLLIGFGFGGQIAYMAHIGGFIAGLVLARPLLLSRFNRR